MLFETQEMSRSCGLNQRMRCHEYFVVLVSLVLCTFCNGAVIDCTQGMTANFSTSSTISIAPGEGSLVVKNCWLGQDHSLPLFITTDASANCSNLVVDVWNVSGFGSFYCGQPTEIRNVSISLGNSTIVFGRDNRAFVVSLSAPSVLHAHIHLLHVEGVMEKLPSLPTAVVSLDVTDRIRGNISDSSVQIEHCQFDLHVRPDVANPSSSVVAGSSPGWERVSVAFRHSRLHFTLQSAIVINGKRMNSTVRVCGASIISRNAIDQFTFISDHVQFTSVVPAPYGGVFYTAEVSLMRIEGEKDATTTFSNVDLFLHHTAANISSQVGSILLYVEGSPGGGENFSVVVKDTAFIGIADGGTGMDTANSVVRRKVRMLDMSSCILSHITITFLRVVMHSIICPGTRNITAAPEWVRTTRSELMYVTLRSFASIAVQNVTVSTNATGGYFYVPGEAIFATTTIITSLVNVGNDYHIDMMSGFSLVASNVTLTVTDELLFLPTYPIFSGIMWTTSLFSCDSSLTDVHVAISEVRMTIQSSSADALAVLPSWVHRTVIASLVTFFNPENIQKTFVPSYTILPISLSNVTVMVSFVDHTLLQGTDNKDRDSPVVLGVSLLDAVVVSLVLVLSDSQFRSMGDAGGSLIQLGNSTLSPPSRIVVRRCSLSLSATIVLQPPLIRKEGVVFELSANEVAYHSPPASSAPPVEARFALRLDRHSAYLDADVPHTALWNITNNAVVGFHSMFGRPWTFWAPSARVLVGCNTWDDAHPAVHALTARRVGCPRWALDYIGGVLGDAVCLPLSESASPSLTLPPQECVVRTVPHPLEVPLYPALTSGGVVPLLMSGWLVTQWKSDGSVTWPWGTTASWGVVTSVRLASNVTSFDGPTARVYIALGGVSSVFKSYTSRVTFALPPSCTQPVASIDIIFRGAEPPIPETARIASQAVAMSAGVIAAVGAGSVASAVTMQRAMLSLQLSVCEFSDAEELSAADSPTQLSFGPVDGAYMRGAVLGNLAVLAAFWHLVVALSAVRVWRRGEAVNLANVQTQARLAGLPGVMVVALALFLQPTIGSGVALLGGRFAATDVLIGAIGVVVPCACVAWLDMRTLLYFGCVARAVDGGKQGTTRRKAGSDSGKGGIGDVLDRFFAARMEWVPRRGARPYFNECYGAVFEEYTSGRHWFFAVESGVAFLCGVLSGLRPQTEAGCAALLWINLVVAIFCAMSTLLWPFRSAHGNFNYALGNVGMLACALLVLTGADAASDWISVALVMMTVLSSASSVAAFVLRLHRRWWQTLRAAERRRLSGLGTLWAFAARWMKVGTAQFSVIARSHQKNSWRRRGDERKHLQNAGGVALVEVSRNALLASLIEQACQASRERRRTRRTVRCGPQ